MNWLAFREGDPGANGAGLVLPRRAARSEFHGELRR